MSRQKKWRDFLFAIVIVLICIAGGLCQKDQPNTALLVWLTAVLLAMVRAFIKEPLEEGEEEHEEGS